MTCLLRILAAVLFVASMALSGAAANAQNYPNKPVTIIVPFSPGAASDTITRIAQPLGAALNQTIVVENKAGANGAIAAAYVAHAAPTPRGIIARLGGELRKIIDSPDIKAKMGTLGFEAFSSSPEELDHFTRIQLDKWSKMIKDAGIEPE